MQMPLAEFWCQTLNKALRWRAYIHMSCTVYQFNNLANLEQSRNCLSISGRSRAGLLPRIILNP